jgi:hypothetical protein
MLRGKEVNELEPYGREVLKLVLDDTSQLLLT